MSGRAAGGAAPPDPEPAPAPILDAHTHLDAMAQRAGLVPDRDFVAAAMARARAVGVHAVVTVGDTLQSSAWCVRAAEEHPDVYAAVGVHPTEVRGLGDAGYAELERLAASERVVAIGETGLDYYWDRTTRAEQHEHFRRHIDLAGRVGKTLMIHDRDAHEDVLEVLADSLESAAAAPMNVVFHAFSGGVEMAQECVRRGHFLSFSGVVTFTNAPLLRAAAAVVPNHNILVETDAPFLTPHPYRGRPNAPYLLPCTLAGLARARSADPLELAAAVRASASRAFGIEVCAS